METPNYMDMHQYYRCSNSNIRSLEESAYNSIVVPALQRAYRGRESISRTISIRPEALALGTEKLTP
jgi:hypothetical protein